MNCGEPNKAKRPSLQVRGARVTGSVLLHDGFRALGMVNLVGSRIDGNLECNQGVFLNGGRVALDADRIEVHGDVFLCTGSWPAESAVEAEGFRAEGEVKLVGSTVRGTLDCKGGLFDNPGNGALTATNSKVEGNVLLHDGFMSRGTVDLVGATVGGNLECGKGVFIKETNGAVNAEEPALFADGLKVKGNAVFNDGCKVEGEASLVGAKIDGFFYWTDIDSPRGTTLDLRSAVIGTLRDDDKSWPEKENLLIHGLAYERIHDKAPSKADSRIEWLRKQPRKEFHPQPYEQLAKVLREGGHESAAKSILICKNDDRIWLASMGFLEKCWHILLGLLMGYGYRPSQAFLWMVGFVVVGAFLFGNGHSRALITPTRQMEYVLRPEAAEAGKKCTVSEDYPAFQAVVYSVDVFVPLVDLQQCKYWQPNSKRGKVVEWGRLRIREGQILVGYMWFHIVTGWIVTTLFIVGLTGLVRR